MAPQDIETVPDSPASPGPEDSAFSEDMALAWLKRRDLPAHVIEQLAKNSAVMKLRKVRLALAAHPLTPRRLALRIIRELYTFDLMQFALLPAAAADLKRIADELLVSRLASVTLADGVGESTPH